ncbi:hypothetical protein [Microbacterium lacticum]|uniref:hypothetical protein n=1 Tax=Microbacterium lacticum TaxID=33885 RepID=UPI001F59BF96|nr:hypothetical protein [Microbacterium lacticum]
MDPLALALLSIFGGAALTAGAGFLGAWIQSRRETAKWWRDERLRAYVALLQRTDVWISAAQVDLSNYGANVVTDAPDDVMDALTALDLVGPRRVQSLAVDFVHAASVAISHDFAIPEQQESLGAARYALAQAAREALGQGRR